MKFNKTQHVITRVGDLATITIFKDALEEWRAYFANQVDNTDSVTLQSYFSGRVDAINDILEHFKED